MTKQLFMEKIDLRTKMIINKKALLIVFFLTGVFYKGYTQGVQYVTEQNIASLSGNQNLTDSYYFTKSVTITATTGNSVTISSTGGNKFITLLPINPPPSPNENYVRVEVPKIPVSSEKDLTLLNADDKNTSYSYSDGLGRTLMTTAAEVGPNYEDLVQHSHYDPATGRQNRSYLPYSKSYANPGAFQSNTESETMNFYGSPPSEVTGDTKPFSYIEYDERSRVKSVVSPGSNWHTASTSTAKRTNYEYFVHNPSETDPSVDFEVKHWKIVSGSPQNDRNYSSNELSVTMVTDPQGRRVRTVQDMRGLTITTQSYDATNQIWIGSYNVYDDFGRVRFVIPALISSNLDNTFPNNFSTTQIDELMFQYKYDERGRTIEEKAPGSGWNYYVYDEWDRVVMSRYEGQKFEGSNSWTFYKYDALHRQVMSGEIKTNESRPTIQGKVNGSLRYEIGANDEYGYTLNRTFPELPSDYSLFKVLNIQYFDNYSFMNNTNWELENSIGSYNYEVIPGFTGTQLNNALNLSTGSKIRILDSNKWLNSVVYYDDEARILQTYVENHLGELDRITNQFDWEGRLLKTELEHDAVSATGYYLTVLKEYEYDHEGRILKQWQTINDLNFDGGGRVLISSYNYNALGELVEKNLHSTNGSSFLQSVDYRYNIQGSLSAINDPELSDGEGDVFGMNYHYETPVSINNTNTQPRFDGYTNAITWNATNITPSVTPTSGPNGQIKTAVGYQYSDKNQLTGTNYGQAALTSNSFNQSSGHYDMTATYDENGNITELTRKADNKLIDDLDYTYPANSNKLTGVADAAPNEGGLNDYYTGPTDYVYDPETGNMTSDMNKQIVAIDYNHLQLVNRIEFGDGTEINYQYDAVGNRLLKTIIDNDNNVLNEVDYVGLIEYLDGHINQIFTPQGRAYLQNRKYHYEYFITDHQENNRVAFGDLPERNIYLSTMESNNASYEESEFVFPSGIRSTTQNHTPLGLESVALNGTVSGKEIGPAKVLTIANGDEVELEVWAKYTDSGWNNSSISNIVATILSTFGGASTGTGAETASGNLNTALSTGAPGVFSGNTSGQPEAYLQYMFFDANYNYVSSRSGFSAVGNDSNGKFAKYTSGKLVFDQPGYLFIYVVNESDQNKEVFFDDLKITHSSAASSFKVTQINDYYPFGLPTSNSWRASGYIDPGLLYQSSFATYDSLTGYYNFLSRSYDPVLGRFFQVDPASQFSSPYTGMGNIPHMTIDPNGEIAWFVPIIIGAALGGTAGGIKSVNSGGTFLGGFWKGALVGGAAVATGIGVSAWASGSAFTAVGAGTASVGFGGVVAGGAASGFLSGSTNAWINGASFKEGLGAGLKGAAIGGATAGVLKGISDGMGKIANNVMDREVTNLKNATASVKHEWAYDEITGTWKLVSWKGGQKEHYFHIGRWVDGGSGFKGNMFFSTGSKAVNAFRIWQSAQSTVSTFIIPTTGLSGYILEPAGPSTTIRNQDQRIPAGQYNLDWFTRPSGTIVPRLSNATVPQDRLILSHIGNYPGDTAGCQLPGCTWGGGDSIGSSASMMSKIISYFNRVGIEESKWNIYDAF